MSLLSICESASVLISGPLDNSLLCFSKLIFFCKGRSLASTVAQATLIAAVYKNFTCIGAVTHKDFHLHYNAWLNDVYHFICYHSYICHHNYSMHH